ncbi:hypothetical protein SDC9_98446 [bioreactor metagenome]|uniref:Uncharacterized protein n=1 Tax=bioreactor metagenome TaxID=1076179 RepID=A0A645AER8_9ZZZZ
MQPTLHPFGGPARGQSLGRQARHQRLKQARKPFRQRRVNIFHHRRQQHRQAQAMGKVRLDRAQRMFQRMSIMQHAVVEAHACAPRSVKQEITRPQILRVAQRIRQIFGHQSDGFARQRQAEGIGHLAGRRFDHMIDRIDADIARLFFRKPGHQRRIVDRPKRVNAVVSDSRLILFARNGDDCEPVAFRPGAVGQVDRHDRNRLGRSELIFVQRSGVFIGVLQQDCRALAGVDRAAAADGDHGACLGVAAEFHRRINLRGGRIGRHLIKQHETDSGGAQCRLHLVPGACSAICAAAGDDQRRFDAATGQVFGNVVNFGNGAATEPGRVGGAQVLDRMNIKGVVPHVMAPRVVELVNWPAEIQESVCRLPAIPAGRRQTGNDRSSEARQDSNFRIPCPAPPYG